MKGYEADTWDVVNEEDLVSMTDRYHDKDIIAKWIEVYIIPLYHRALGNRLKARRPSSTAQINTPTKLLHSCRGSSLCLILPCCIGPGKAS